MPFNRLVLLLSALISALIGLASCQSNPVSDPSLDTVQSAVVQWQRDPLNVVFRADIVGGNRSASQVKNVVPYCSIYGDGRVVWTTTGEGGSTQVLFDYLSDARIADFINTLTVNYRIYTYEEGFANSLPSGGTTPVYDQIIVNVNGQRHVADTYSNWEGDYFNIVANDCRSLAPTPRIFKPEGAWLSVEQVEPQSYLPTIYWDNETTGLLFGSLADGSTRWIEGTLVSILWENVIEAPVPIQFTDVTGTYVLALQVPGVTLDAPPAPADGTATTQTP
jgi:hypothetical protein